MARSTPLPRSSTRSAAGSDSDPTETNFGADDGADDEEEEGGEDEDMSDAERRRARGDAVGDADDDDDDEEDEEGDDDEEEEEEDDDEGDDEGDDEEDEEGDDSDDDGDDAEGDDDGDDDLDALEAIAGGGSKTVPLSRLNEVLAMNAKLVDAVLATRSPVKDPAAPAEPEFDLKAKRKELRTAIFDGDEAKAEALEGEIDAYTTRKAKSETEQAVSTSVQAALEKVQVESTISKIQSRYPIFNDTSPKYDATALQDMIDLRNVYMSRGMSMVEALRKASEKIGGPVQKAPAKAAKAGDRPASKAGQENRSIRDKRRQMDAARRQPGNIGRGAGSGDRAVSRMSYGENGPSESQIRRMSPKERAIARGDFVGKQK